jgi:transaldolase/transaldolase/glucose-6-phosphate isomerase
LWASTSTKNPAYQDTKYVEPLIGPETINTVPIETLNAYRDHGNPRQTLDHDVSEAYKLLAALPSLGLDLNKTTDQLEQEGVEKFNAAFERLIVSLKEKQAGVHELAGR